MRNVKPRSADQKSEALPTELIGHTVTTWKYMYLPVNVSSRKDVNIKQEKC